MGWIIGAPSSTYNARSCRCTNVFKDIIAEDAIPDKVKTWIMKLGEIPLDTVGDAFPRFVWLLEIFNENTQDPKERYYNKKLCSVRAVAEICYVMLKSRLRRIYKRCICKLENSKFIVLAQRWI